MGVPGFALLAFHFPGEDLRAWRLALRVDRDFARECIGRIEVVRSLRATQPSLQEMVYSLGEGWPGRVRVLAVSDRVDATVFDEELGDALEVAHVDKIPSFARDITEPGEHQVALGVSDAGVWIQYSESGEPGAQYTAEFVTAADLARLSEEE